METIQFNTRLKKQQFTIRTRKSDVVDRFLNSWKNEIIPHKQWEKCCHENNIKSEIIG